MFRCLAASLALTPRQRQPPAVADCCPDAIVFEQPLHRIPSVYHSIYNATQNDSLVFAERLAVEKTCRA